MPLTYWRAQGKWSQRISQKKNRGNPWQKIVDSHSVEGKPLVFDCQPGSTLSSNCLVAPIELGSDQWDIVVQKKLFKSNHRELQFMDHGSPAQNPSLDCKTLSMLREVLDEAVTFLPSRLQTQDMKLQLAERLLKAASNGERDRTRLRSAALPVAKHPSDNLRTA